MLRPKITDPKILKYQEEYMKKSAEIKKTTPTAWDFSELEALLEEEEKEPGYWERQAELEKQRSAWLIEKEEKDGSAERFFAWQRDEEQAEIEKERKEEEARKKAEKEGASEPSPQD